MEIAMAQRDRNEAHAVKAADALAGGAVVTRHGDPLGTIEDIMIDVRGGTVAYAVISRGGEGAGERLFAIPWAALTFDASGRFVLDADQERYLA
jgi:sporulation protein YlmC with PRC-barrel domain